MLCFLGLQSTPVMLTKKNLLVTHSVLRLCLESGAILLTSWLTVLTTLQHLCWVCGIVPKSSTDFISAHSSGKLSSDGKQSNSSSLPSSGYDSQTSSINSTTSGFSTGVGELSVTSSEKVGNRKSYKGTNGSVGSSGGVMSVVVDFVSCLSHGVTRLIETSVSLDDVSLHHVINALTNLSQEAMEIAYSNRVSLKITIAMLIL